MEGSYLVDRRAARSCQCMSLNAKENNQRQRLFWRAKIAERIGKKEKDQGVIESRRKSRIADGELRSSEMDEYTPNIQGKSSLSQPAIPIAGCVTLLLSRSGVHVATQPQPQADSSHRASAHLPVTQSVQLYTSPDASGIHALDAGHLPP